MPPNQLKSIYDQLSKATGDGGRLLDGLGARVAIGDLLHATSLGGRLGELADRCVLLASRDQLASALALIELDGVARRIVICPPDVSWDYYPAVIEKCGVDAVVADHELDAPCLNGLPRVTGGAGLTPNAGHANRHPHANRRSTDGPTEWVLLTSGTTGAPKMIVHTLATLAAPINLSAPAPTAALNPKASVVWGTFYDIRRYGGMQIFLRAVLGGASLVLSSATEPLADHLSRLGASGVTHLTGTPSHWRRVLMSPLATAIAPSYVRLSGEIADQAILNALAAFFPSAAVGHAFASTEAGVAFEVNDGLAGFPASMLGQRGDVEMRVVDDSLQIRSNRAAFRYMDGENGVLADGERFVDTGDIVELRDGRYYFLGRRNGVINVGGLKVFPEEVEGVINSHPAVRMSRVRSRKNPISGALVAAEVVLRDAAEGDGFQDEIIALCRQHLTPHKIPVTVRCVASLEVAAAGKLARHA